MESKDKYFVFECYAGRKFLFRSFSSESWRVDPRPHSDLALRQTQLQYSQKDRLIYYFIAYGQPRDAAERLAQQLDNMDGKLDLLTED